MRVEGCVFIGWSLGFWELGAVYVHMCIIRWRNCRVSALINMPPTQPSRPSPPKVRRRRPPHMPHVRINRHNPLIRPDLVPSRRPPPPPRPINLDPLDRLALPRRAGAPLRAVRVAVAVVLAPPPPAREEEVEGAEGADDEEGYAGEDGANLAAREALLSLVCGFEDGGRWDGGGGGVGRREEGRGRRRLGWEARVAGEHGELSDGTGGRWVLAGGGDGADGQRRLSLARDIAASYKAQSTGPPLRDFVI